jgi:hypothetical protein
MVHDVFDFCICVGKNVSVNTNIFDCRDAGIFVWNCKKIAQ